MKVLIIDDEDRFLEDTQAALRSIGCDCETVNDAVEARELLRSRLYDAVLCDVLIPLDGRREGGILLVEEFSGKYPVSSFILISQYVTAKWVNIFSSRRNIAFIEKNDSFLPDLRMLLSNIVETRRAFVCMPFGSLYQDVYELGIKPALMERSYLPERVDEMEFTGRILDVIYGKIRSSHIVIAEVSEENVNVYYEIGYAHALEKEVLFISKTPDNIPFDVNSFNHLLYNSSITELKRKLSKRLSEISVVQ